MTGKELMRIDPLAGLWTEAEELDLPAVRFPASFPEVFGKDQEFKVEEGKKELKLTMKTPGYEKKDLKVSVKDGMLTVSGERKEENRTKDGCSYSSSYSSFSRSTPLPGGVNARKAKVEVKNGEVKIVMPKNGCK